MAEVCFCKFLHFHKWQYKLIGNISAKQFACWLSSCSLLQQVAQLSQRDRTAGWVNYGQKWKTGTERQYFTDITGLSPTTVMYM